MWNNTDTKPLGTCTLKLRNPNNNKKYRLDFVVGQENLTPVPGKVVSEKMGLITVNYNNFQEAKVTDMEKKPEDMYPDVFQHDGEVGQLPGGPVTLVLDDGAIPQQLPAKREPVALRGKLKNKLDELCDRDMLVKVDEPTDWVHQMATQEKSGDVRICLDPRLLNLVLKREHFSLPILEEMLPYLNNAKVFSKFDLANRYWHVELTEESSLLTTFATPYGRYRWKRLPFGLNVSSEIFQKRLLQALEGLDGVFCVADDIIVFGRGDTKEQAYLDHDKNLRQLMIRCTEVGIKLNREKSEFRKDSVSFLGHEITCDGLTQQKFRALPICPIPRTMKKCKFSKVQKTI